MRSFIAAIITALALPVAAYAESVLDTIGNRLRDPVGANEAVEELGRILDRARAHADELLSQGHDNIEGYLDRLEVEAALTRTAIADALARGEDIVVRLNTGLSQQMNDLRALEQQFILDTSVLLQCAAVKTGDELRRTFADVVGDIARSRPRLEIDPPIGGPVILGELVIDEQTVPEPIVGWEMMVLAYEAVIADVSADDPLSVMTNAYDSIVLHSEDTLCFYRDDSSAYARVSLVMAEYARRSRVWQEIIF